jgi:hypothetical protein
LTTTFNDVGSSRVATKRDDTELTEGWGSKGPIEILISLTFQMVWVQSARREAFGAFVPLQQ